MHDEGELPGTGHGGQAYGRHQGLPGLPESWLEVAKLVIGILPLIGEGRQEENSAYRNCVSKAYLMCAQSIQAYTTT